MNQRRLMTFTDVQTQGEESARAVALLDHPGAAVAVELPDDSRENLRDADVALLQDFVAGSCEHFEAIEAHLLAIEADHRSVGPLNAVSRAVHTIKGLAGFAELDHIRELADGVGQLLDVACSGELDLDGDTVDLVFESVDVMKRLVESVVEALATGGRPDEVAELPALVGRLIATADGAPIPPTDGAPDLRCGAATPFRVKETVPVDAERLDRLVETISEMVAAGSLISRNPGLRGSMTVTLAKDLDHLDRVCRELQEIGTSLRMVPVRPVFRKLARLVRDLARKTGRKVELVMAGEDTELDRKVVETIADPLVHMVRNALHHGIELSGDERTAAGKPEAGRLELRAFHEGGAVCIEVEDDGRGLPRQAILKQAVERGLVREGEILADHEIDRLAFEPGLSTAERFTAISGRGVGLDVVRRSVEELRGTCTISSEPGRGSTIRIRLPLALSLIEGIVIRCGSERYVVPTLSVVRLVRPSPDDIAPVFDRCEILAFAGEHLPLLRLDRLFDLPSAAMPAENAVVVVVEDEGCKMGLLADDLLGQQSIVVKSLGEAVQDTAGVAGGAVMSDGSVALILDVAGLVRVAHAAVPPTLEEERMSTDTVAATLAKPGKYLAFVLGGGEYGLEILKVQEVLGITDVARIPRTPPYLRGVINLRGRVIPVIELRSKYRMPSVADTENTCIIVVQVARGDLNVTMGMIVDEVSEVLSFTRDQIEAAPGLGGDRHEVDSITGVGKLGRKAVILLDADRVLTAEELAAVAKSEGKEVPL